MYSSHNVCEFFGVSRETVRTWAHEFSDFLSPTVNPEKGRTRQFTDEDLRVLALVSEMKKQGLLYTDVKAALGAGQRGELPTAAHAIVPGERNKLAEMESRIADLQTALSELMQSDQRKAGEIESLSRQLEAAQAKIERLTGENAVLKYRLEDRINPPPDS